MTSVVGVVRSEKYVVTDVTEVPHDGRSAQRVTDYDYDGSPAWHADDNEVVKASERTYGQFRGFAEVGVRTGDPGSSFHGVADKQTSTMTRYYRGMGSTIGDSISGDSAPDDDQYAGMVHEVQTFDGVGGAEIRADIKDAATQATTATRTRTGLPALTATVVVTTTSRDITDEPGVSATATRTATSMFTYDAFGQQVQRSDTFDDGTPSACTTTTYATPAAGNNGYIYNRVAEQIVSQQSCPALGTAPSPVLTDVRTFYDGAATSGVPSRGLATEVDTLLDSTSGLRFGKAQATFDTAGRQLSATQFVSASDTTGRTTTTAYTPTLPVTVGSVEPLAGPVTKVATANPLGQTTSTAFDAGRGVTTESVDVAGHKTDAQYDALGRLTGVWRPGQTLGSTSATVSYSYVVATSGPSSITTKTLVDSGTGTSTVTSIALLDAFGTTDETQSDAPGGGRVVTDNFTDSHGWVRDSYNKYPYAGPPTTSLLTSVGDGNVADRTQTDYDGSGRVVKATDYNELTPTWSTQTVYGGNQTTVIPPTGGVAQTTVTDARGWTTALEQYTSAPSVTGDVVTGTHTDTTYDYTALGQRKTMQANGRTWSWTYDNGGRVVSQVDPDSGTSATQFDDLGEPTQTTDANQVVLSYTYDGLGRKTAVYHTATQTAANELDAWVYDSVQPGQLSYSLHFTAPSTAYKVETTQYDYAGRALDSKVTLPAGAEPDFLSSYSTSYAYTTTGLLKSLTPAPGGSLPSETLNYTYDALGEPTSMRGTNVYVGSANYTAFGQPQQYQLGVNSYLSSLTYSYDAQTHRLTDEGFDTTAVTSQVEDEAYSYDASGNVVKTVDTQGAPGAAVETQCFRYTARDQLSEAWSATDGCANDPATVGNIVIGGPQAYWTSWYLYDSGLRDHVVQHAVSGPASGDKTTSYSYNLTGHADGLSNTSGALTSSYQEDAVGNVTARTLSGANLSLTYDYENRTAS